MPAILAELRCYDLISGDVSRVPRFMVIGTERTDKLRVAIAFGRTTSFGWRSPLGAPGKLCANQRNALAVSP